MFRKSSIVALVTVIGLFSVVACTNQSKENLTPDTSGLNCDTTAVTYSSYVKTVMDASCATSGCHDASSQSSGVNLSTYEGTKAAALNTSKKNTSLLLGAINHASGFSEMPQSAAKLSDCTIEKITAWINDGTSE